MRIWLLLGLLILSCQIIAQEKKSDIENEENVEVVREVIISDDYELEEGLSEDLDEDADENPVRGKARGKRKLARGKTGVRMRGVEEELEIPLCHKIMVKRYSSFIYAGKIIGAIIFLFMWVVSLIVIDRGFKKIAKILEKKD